MLYPLSALGVAAAAALAFYAAQPEESAAVQDDAPLPAAPADPFVLGVQTHFSQGWPADRLETAEDLHAPLLRDGMAWGAAEKTPGQFAFPAARMAPLKAACAAGIKLMLTVVPTNPLYDGGLLVTSDSGRQAFGRYLDALAGQFGSCLIGIEVGNEINGARSLGDRRSLPQNYVGLLQAIHGPFRAKHPRVAIIGGSTNAVGTGYLAKLFDLGLLEHADAIAVHPYRRTAEGLEWEIRHLQRTMQRHGQALPIWASEFSDTFENPQDGADALVKVATILAGSGVENASWYALYDQTHFPTMGLVTADGEDKPAAGAFRLMQTELLPKGRPTEVKGDPLVSLWRYAPDRWVVWGAPQALQVQPGTRVLDASGNPVRNPRVGGAPLVVLGPQPRLGGSDVLADSLLQFGTAPFSYLAGTAEGLAARKPRPLQVLDSEFQSSLGGETLRPLRIDAATGATIAPAPVTVRYTAPAAMRVTALACLSRSRKDASTVRATLHAGGRDIGTAVFGPAGMIRQDVTLAAGDTLDLRLAPEAGPRGHVFGYRLQLYRPGTAPAACPDPIAGWS